MENILIKFAERGTEALIIGVILLVLAPMIFRLVDKMLAAMREEAALERKAGREEAAAARLSFREESALERNAHREETKALADAMRALELATHDQTAAVTLELRHQTSVLERIQESGDIPRLKTPEPDEGPEEEITKP